jgi:hypothetical protein
MNQPEDNGGLTACDADGALAAVDRAFAEPDCCRSRSAAWLEGHIHGRDGHTSERMAEVIEALVAG